MAATPIMQLSFQFWFFDLNFLQLFLAEPILYKNRILSHNRSRLFTGESSSRVFACLSVLSGR